MIPGWNPPALIVYTGEVPHHKKPGYRGPDFLNITRGSAQGLGLHFAPSRELLNEGQRRKNAAKSDEAQLAAAWDWYAPRYLDEMRALWARDRDPFHQLFLKGEVTLCCYCGTFSRCHRTLLAVQVLVPLGAEFYGEREG